MTVNSNYSRAGDTLVLELFLSLDTTLSDLGSGVVVDVAETFSYHQVSRRESVWKKDFSCDQIEDSLAALLNKYGVDSLQTLGYYEVNRIGNHHVSNRRVKSLGFYLPKDHSPQELYDSLKKLLPVQSLVKFHSALIATSMDESKVANSLKAQIRDSIYKQHLYFSERAVDTLLNIIVINLSFNEPWRTRNTLGQGEKLKIDMSARRYNLFIVYGIMYVLN